jgi:putative ABC transport system permease protein
MGVAAVSATLNIQSITNAQIKQKLAERDRPFVVPYLYSDSFETPQLGATDRLALKQAVPVIRSISSIGEVYAIRSVQFESREVNDIQVQGVSPNYLETTGRKIVQGRFFAPIDFAEFRPVAILDEKLAATLFQGRDPIRQTIFAAGNRFTVIGVTQTKSLGMDFQTQGTLWLTEEFATALQGGFRSSNLQISPYKLEDMKELRQKVEQVLQQRHPQMTVYLNDNASDLLAEKEMQKIAAGALAVVGLIALGIGGVGIANITIAAVMERTKEIGIRRAIGATRVEVMLQFILEAVLLSVVGGVSAIATVHGLTYVITTVALPAPYQFSVQNTVLAMGAAVLVGVGSSFFPALGATKIEIVKALRSE